MRFRLFIIIVALTACKKEATGPQDLVNTGRGIYQAVCVACHNSNPKLDGAIGPSVWGSSRELLESRLVKNTYPEGYTPKRATKLMPVFPQYADKMDALAKYLNQ